MTERQHTSFDLVNKVAVKFALLSPTLRTPRELINIIRGEFMLRPGKFTNNDLESEVKRFQEWKSAALIQNLNNLKVRQLTDSQMIGILAMGAILDERKIDY